MPLESLQDLLLEELRDLHSAEQQLVKALPRMARSATNPALKDAFLAHLRETEEHLARLDQVFESLGEHSIGKRCKGMHGLIAEGREMLDEDGHDAVRDAGIIAAAQRVEHYEIAAYGCAVTYARMLGYGEIAAALGRTLIEEEGADRTLTSIAESEVNAAALAAGAEIAGD